MCAPLIEYRDNYSEIVDILWQYHKDEPKNSITDCYPFKFEAIFLPNANDQGIIKADISVPFKYLSHFWITLGMLLFNCGINLLITCSTNSKQN